MSNKCPYCQNLIDSHVILKKGDGLEHSVPFLATEKKDFDHILLSLYVVLLILLLDWWYELEIPGVVVPLLGLGVSMGLYSWRLWLYRPRQQEVKEQQQKVDVRIEEMSKDKRHWFLNDLRMDISSEKLYMVADKLMSNDGRWSRRLVCSCGLSQTKATELRDKLVELTYLYRAGKANKYEATWRGRRVFNKLMERNNGRNR